MSKATMTNFFQSLIAVLAGNVAYFLLMPHLPPAARHVPQRLDLGVFVDLWLCLVVLGIVKTLARWKRDSNPT